MAENRKTFSPTDSDTILVFSERVRYICYRRSVCRLSVCLSVTLVPKSG